MYNVCTENSTSNNILYLKHIMNNNNNKNNSIQNNKYIIFVVIHKIDEAQSVILLGKTSFNGKEREGGKENLFKRDGRKGNRLAQKWDRLSFVYKITSI